MRIFAVYATANRLARVPRTEADAVLLEAMALVAVAPTLIF